MLRSTVGRDTGLRNWTAMKVTEANTLFMANLSLTDLREKSVITAKQLLIYYISYKFSNNTVATHWYRLL